jgi:hypothetical protein
MLTQTMVAAPERIDELRGVIGLGSGLPCRPPLSRPAGKDPEPGADRALERVVRRALNQQAALLPVTRRIHEMARRLAGPDWQLDLAGRERLVELVTRILGA